MKAIITAAMTLIATCASTSSLAISSTCDVGPVTGHVSYNVPYHIATYTAADFVHGNLIKYKSVYDPPGSGSNIEDEDWGSMTPGGGKVGSFIKEPVDGAYGISGSEIIGTGAPPPFYVLGNSFTGCVAVVRNVSNPAFVSLTVPALRTLNDDYTFTVDVLHPFASVTNNKIEIKRSAHSTYDTLYNGSSLTLSSYSKVAGTFNVRATVTLSTGASVTTPIENHEVRFMTATQIGTNAANLAAAQGAFSTMLSVMTSTTRREVGTWVKFNTATRAYEYGTLVHGPDVSNTGTPPPSAYVDLPAPPSDSPPTLPSPISSPTYLVAAFHTHTAGTNLTSGYCTSSQPSAADVDNASTLVPELLYSYTANLHCSGDSTADAKSMKYFGLDRRATP